MHRLTREEVGHETQMGPTYLARHKEPSDMLPSTFSTERVS